MSLFRASVLALAVAALAPSAASASDRFVARDEPLGDAGAGVHESAARRAPVRFDLVGLHWKGKGRVWFRTAPVPGRWSPWHPAAPEAGDLPGARSREARARRGWTLGSPYWTGPATTIQYRLAGGVSGLRAYFIWSDPSTPPSRFAAGASPRAVQPAIIRRSDWGADESIVRASPYYASAVHFAVVHHTAGTNSYSASESAAIVRGIERYHVLANGWNDIGYNFLVDKYGQVFEGRAGGIARNVVGAHAQGFNTGSTGVAVLGSYETQTISAAARAALVGLLAWRLDVAHVNPLSRVTWISGGNPKYPAGMAVTLHAISGHRDTGPTACPGGTLYAQLPGIADDVATTGLPKLYRPVVRGSLGEPVRFTAALSSPLAWTVAVFDAAGATVASGTGTSRLVDWTWDARAIPFGAFTYAITAGPDVLAVRGTVPGPPRLRITTLRARPHTVTPNGDGVGEASTISYSLTTRATVKVEVVDSSARVVRALATSQSYRSGTKSLIWNGRNSSGGLVRDGHYRLRLTASSPGQLAVKGRSLTVDRTLGHLAVSPTPFSPNGDDRLDSSQIDFRLARQADVRVSILQGKQVIATVQPAAPVAAGSSSVTWNGRAQGVTAPEGSYSARVEATTALGTRTLALAVVVDTHAPVVRMVSARRRDGRTVVRLWLSEPASLRIRYGSRAWLGDGPRVVNRPSGYSGVSLPPATRVRVRGVDAASNVGAVVFAHVVR
jgi:flagellar hook assembly protein FlgD